MLGRLKSVGNQEDARFKKNGRQRIQMRLRYRWLHGASICTTFDGWTLIMDASLFALTRLSDCLGE